MDVATTVWKGTLTFGLVAIPIRLYRAARAEKVKFRHVYRSAAAAFTPPPLEEDRSVEEEEPPEEPERTPAAPIAPEPFAGIGSVAPVRHAAFSAEQDRPLRREEVIKAYEFEPDRYVPVAAEELARLAPPASTTMEILEFVRFVEVDPIYLETSYYAAPDRGGDKPYALLVDALRETGYAAVAQLVMHRREHVVILRPGRKGLVLHTLFYPNEVRAGQEFQADATLVTAKERELATLFIKALAGPFDASKYKDTYRERVEALIAGKLREAPPLASAAAPARAPVVDIMDALRKSLAQVRKPPAPERNDMRRTNARPASHAGRSKRHKT